MNIKKSIFSSIARLHGLGHLPMSGTLASALTAIIWIGVTSTSPAMQALIIGAIAILGFFATQSYLQTVDVHDPREVVIDEVLGMSIALFAAPPSLPMFLVTFIIFRLLDIFKPFPINRCENFPDAWGVLMDDAVAGLIALIFRIVLFGSF